MPSTDRSNHADIRIGTMAGKGELTAEFVEKLVPLGFECFQINFWQAIPEKVDLLALAEKLRRILGDAGRGQVISSLGVYGNPLQDGRTASDLAKAIDACEAFGCDVVSGFAGAVEGRPVPESMPRVKEIWGELAARASDRGVRLAWENCPMGGTWEKPRFNVAFCPAAWEMLFDALGDPKHVGLEWEPCHQMGQLIDPIAQLRKWAPKVIRLHGKDASLYRDVIATQGIHGPATWFDHRTPGFGDTNWHDVFSILRQHGFSGFCDIEGYHDPVYRNDLEMTGQVHALRYLQHCRGGEFVPMPQA